MSLLDTEKVIRVLLLVLERERYRGEREYRDVLLNRPPYERERLDEPREPDERYDERCELRRVDVDLDPERLLERNDDLPDDRVPLDRLDPDLWLEKLGALPRKGDLEPFRLKPLRCLWNMATVSKNARATSAFGFLE